MNYEKIYKQLIERAHSENRQKGCGVYFERHHIIPKCLGGTNNKTNLILLTAREHFIAHKLLCEIYPAETKLHYALWRMMNLQTKNHERNYIVSSNEYERHKKTQQEHVQKLGLLNMGKSRGPMSDEHKQKIRESISGRKLSETTKEKISEANKGKRRSAETIEKLKCKRPSVSKKLTGRKQSPDVIQNRVSKNTGKIRSDETRLKISAATKGKPKNKKLGK